MYLAIVSHTETGKVRRRHFPDLDAAMRWVDSACLGEPEVQEVYNGAYDEWRSWVSPARQLSRWRWELYPVAEPEHAS
jgi:hypothetical protein